MNQGDPVHSGPDMLARFRAAIEARQPLPDEVAAWVMDQIWSQAARDAVIANLVRSEAYGPGSVWRRCTRLSERLEQDCVPELRDYQPIPTSARQLYRIASRLY